MFIHMGIKLATDLYLKATISITLGKRFLIITTYTFAKSVSLSSSITNIPEISIAITLLDIIPKENNNGNIKFHLTEFRYKFPSLRQQ